MSESLPSTRRLEFGALERQLHAIQSRIAWVQEQRLEISNQLMRLFEDSGCEILSLDVFDTVLLRNDKPEALRYYELAERAAQVMGSKVGYQLSADDFYITRFEGMELSYRARREVDSCREGHIEEVYQSQVAQLGLAPGSPEALREIEIDYEADNLTANFALLDLCRAIKGKGGRVILVSDMYLGSDVITEILQRVVGEVGFIDDVVSSADVIVSKRSGQVFPLLQERLKAPAKAFFHVGDNRMADVVCPVQAGWRAMHFPVSAPEEQRRLQRLSELLVQFAARGMDVTRWAKA